MVSRFHFDFLFQCLGRGLAVLLVIVGCAYAAEVEAQLDRDSVAAGNGALLTLTISGSRSARPAMPVVENLIIEPRGQSQQMQIVNGRTSVSMTYRYVVGSNTPGDYQIPSIAVTVDDKELSTQPLKLKVLDSGAAKPPAGLPQGQTAPLSGETDSEDEEDAGRRFGFLTVEPASSDRKFVYVGEIAPVRIRAWIPADAQAQLRSGIQPEGRAFTLHNVSDRSEKAYEVRDGKRYLVVTWYGGISATKAGKYPASLSLDATVAVRDTSAPKPRRARSGPFSDPFFDDIFDDLRAPMIQKDVTLKSDDREIEVRPLPAEGRPDGFTGAVGDFKFDGIEIPSAWNTGEPQQIGARISGSGNFALMKAPNLVPGDVWKTYPGKDEFMPGDVASFSGSKTFQFSAVPRKSGEQEMALKFSYFDPSRGAYLEITSPAEKIQVVGADLKDDEPAAAAAEPAPAMRETELVGQRVKPSLRRTLAPLVDRPAFVPLLASAGVLCVLGGVIGWLRVRGSDPRRRALAAMEHAVRVALGEAGQCASTGDVTGFFSAGRRAIQERLGGLWQQPAQAITLAEIQSRISDDSPAARFFREADRRAYGLHHGSEVSPEWRSLLDEALSSLNPPRR